MSMSGLSDPEFSHEDRRMFRAVDVLILCNTPATRKLLKELAAGLLGKE